MRGNNSRSGSNPGRTDVAQARSKDEPRREKGDRGLHAAYDGRGRDMARTERADFAEEPNPGAGRQTPAQEQQIDTREPPEQPEQTRMGQTVRTQANTVGGLLRRLLGL